jgi:DNA-binding transcriptional ArsR family regulator
LVELTDGTGLTRKGVAKHLGVLEQAGVVARSRVGRESRFSIRQESLAEARAALWKRTRGNGTRRSSSSRGLSRGERDGEAK